MTYSAIVLSGGKSTRFKVDKGSYIVSDKPLISYTIEKIKPFVDEILIITNQEKVSRYSQYFPSLRILPDEYDFRAVLSGATTGFKHVRSDFSFLLPCDTPLIATKLISLLKHLSQDYNAIVPRWPTGYIEPLQAIYRSKEAYKASLESIEEGKLKMRHMILKISNVLYLSTSIIREFDSKLHTFSNINTFKDFKRIERFLG
ncbi:MAG: molybdenum cofactor guanylyltransferase [Candidatus Bathyarchaeota archaeon]|nr:MAG: molybdenum cofactor guanylyltransferase [Candidatus Bathyarchaeota archaeon]